MAQVLDTFDMTPWWPPVDYSPRPTKLQCELLDDEFSSTSSNASSPGLPSPIGEHLGKSWMNPFGYCADYSTLGIRDLARRDIGSSSSDEETHSNLASDLGYGGLTLARSPINYIPSMPESGGNPIQGVVYSRKVFIGGLPPDIDEVSIRDAFLQFGAVSVDWPHKERGRICFPPQGYAFLVFEDARCVNHLLSVCSSHAGKFYVRLSSLTIASKLVQIRPWAASDAEYNIEQKYALGTRFTVFVGGVPRPTTARDLAQLMDRVFGSVGYVAIDVDSEHRYPKGAARVAFTNRDAFAAAVCKRFMPVRCDDNEKQVEMKPFLVECALCDGCQSVSTRQFCANLACLKYLCEQCWPVQHWSPAVVDHRPIVKGPAVARPMRAARRRAPFPVVASF